MIVSNTTEDAVLDYLVGLTIISVGEERPLFENPIEEPYFYQRYFKRWVIEGLEELRKIEAKEAETAKQVQGME